MKVLFFIFFVLDLFANDASNLFDMHCAKCHIKTRPADPSKLSAPPIMGVLRHVKMNYKTKDEAVKFMVDYVFNPSKQKAVCNPQRIQKFGLMPSLKGKVSEEEVKKISEWLYDNFPPKGFVGMFEKKFQNQKNNK